MAATPFQVFVFLIVCALWFGSIYYFLYREPDKAKPREEKHSDDEDDAKSNNSEGNDQEQEESDGSDGGI